MAPSKTPIQETTQQSSSSNCDMNTIISDPTSFPVPSVNFIQQLTSELSKTKSAMEESKKSSRERKDALKKEEWQARSKSNELDDEIKKLQIEYESLQKIEAQKVKALKQEIEKEKNACEEIIQQRKHDAVHVTVLQKLYNDFPGAPQNTTSHV